jgi:perosamine synthetase
MRIGRTISPAASPLYFRDIINGLTGLLRGRREILRFESELKDYFGAKYCFLASSGKAALTIILKALREMHPDRDEVLIPAFTCYSVPSAITRAGLSVRLCEVNPDTLDYDFDSLKGCLFEESDKTTWIKEKTRQHHECDNSGACKVHNSRRSTILAIVPVHLFGLPADVDAVRELVSEQDIAILEDAAQAMGGEVAGRKLGMKGDAGLFSLGRGKALSTIEGGIIVTNNQEIAKNVMAQLDKTPPYGPVELLGLVGKAIFLFIFQYPLMFWLPRSIPFLKLGETFYDPFFRIRKISSFQAGLSRNWKQKLQAFTTYRKKYSVQLSKVNGMSQMHHWMPWNGDIPNFIRFPIIISDHSLRRYILDQSRLLGLGIEKTYPDAVSGIKDLEETVGAKRYPNSEKLSQTMITVPVHPLVSDDDMKKLMKFLSSIGTGNCEPRVARKDC